MVFMNIKRRLGLLSLLGGISAVPLMVAFASTGWGEPGTTAYQTYETLNRLMACSLLLMVPGWLGLFLALPRGYGRWGALGAVVGALLMVAGNAAEFWLYAELSYTCCNDRHIAFTTFLLGSLVTGLGAMVAGMAMVRRGSGPRWLATLLILALPLNVAGFFLLSPFAAAPVLAIALGWRLMTADSRAVSRSRFATE
jgi:hypothetical protein